jgi:hypothetical protein
MRGMGTGFSITYFGGEKKSMTTLTLGRVTALISLVGAATLLSASPSQAANLVSNGDFETGLTGWSVNNPSNHSIGITPVDIDGNGSLGTSNAFFAQTGGGSGTQAVDLGQTVSLLAGQSYSFFANLAAIASQFAYNANGGKVTASIGGVEIASYDFGSIQPQEKKFSTLSGMYIASTTSSALLNINFFRPYLTTSDTPITYIDNIALNELPPDPTSVPEPTPIMGLLAFGVMGASSALKRKQQQKVTAKV